LVAVQGVVHCLETPCDPTVSIILSGVDIDSRVTVSLSPSEESKASYTIRDVLPGLYELQIKHESWCWKENAFRLDLSAEAKAGKSQVQAPNFLHEGYMLSSVVSHDVKVIAALDSSPQQQKTLELNKGTNRHCLREPGIYTLTPVSCYKFERESYKYNTANPRLLDLQATHFLLNVSVLSAQLSPEITIDAEVDNSQKSTSNQAHVKYESLKSVDQREENGKYKHSFSIWVAPGESLSLTPKAPASSDLLFYPPSTTFSLAKPECPSPLPPFEARPGLYMRGRVEPALEGVQINVYSSDGYEIKSLVTASTASSNGSYSIGPLPDDASYQIEAVLEGYHFTETERGVFRAQKLGTVSVTVKDDSGKALPGVVISLSGEDYRNNSPTSQEGEVVLSALHPGSYFLRPLLKEYVFQPSSASVEVKEGVTEKLNISARRIAYSCFGNIHSLNGEPEKFITVEAVSAAGDLEETQTGAEGNFRLRGLQPGKEYRVRVKIGADQRIDRASPSEGYLLSLPENRPLVDEQHKDFLVFRRLPKVDLTGEVNTDPHSLPTLKVEVFQEGNSHVLKSVSLGPWSFFNLGPLPRDVKYLVRVSSSLSPRAYSHAPQEVSVLLNTSTHLKLNFTASAHDPLRHDLASSPFFSFVLTIVLIALIYYHKWAMTVAKALLAGDLQGAKSLLRGATSEEEEDSATSFLSAQQLQLNKGGRKKNNSRPSR